MSERKNRRQLVQLLAGVASAGALGAVVAPGGQSATGPSLRALPWPYQPLDPDAVGQRAFDVFSKGGCDYATFDAIAGSVADRLGAPYKDFPFEMFAYGGGGINGWGTVCGTLNGSAAAFQLLSATPGPLVDALFGWYQSEPLPNFRPKGAKFAEVRSAAGNPLCHEAIAHWCKASGKPAFSPERAEWCATLSGRGGAQSGAAAQRPGRVARGVFCAAGGHAKLPGLPRSRRRAAEHPDQDGLRRLSRPARRQAPETQLRGAAYCVLGAA